MDRRTFVKTLLLSSGAVIFGPPALFSASMDAKTIEILMVYNNVGDSREFLCEWGLSVWVEDRNSAVLFDTGQTPSKLWDNMKKMDVDTRKLSNIIISHNHRDHTGGLGLILEKTGHSPEVFVPYDDKKKFLAKYPKASITGITDAVHIKNNIWTTGSLEGFLHEQAMVLVQDNSMIVVTGCAHPGIVEIVQKAKTIHAGKSISLVMGGFHMHSYAEDVVVKISDQLKNLGVQKIAPSHCTGTTPISVFKERWREDFVDFGAGEGMAIKTEYLN